MSYTITNNSYVPFKTCFLQHFTCIIGLSYVDTYTEDMPFACSFVPLGGNQATKPFRVYLDRIVADDIHFHSYDDHHQIRLSGDIIFYYECLTCGSCMMYSHILECVTRQFGYKKFVPRDLSDSAPCTMFHRDVDAIYDGFLNHLVSAEVQGIVAFSDLSCSYDHV